MENELEERERISELIAGDIKYLKENEIALQRDSIMRFPIEVYESSPLKTALSKIKIFDMKMLKDISIVNLRKYYDDNINPLTHASRAFFSSPTDPKVQNNLIDKARLFNEFIENISDEKKDTNIKVGGGVFVGGVDVSQKIDELSKRIESLENKPDEIVQALKNNFNRSEDLTTSMLDLSKKI